MKPQGSHLHRNATAAVAGTPQPLVLQGGVAGKEGPQGHHTQRGRAELCIHAFTHTVVDAPYLFPFWTRSPSHKFKMPCREPRGHVITPFALVIRGVALRGGAKPKSGQVAVSRKDLQMSLSIAVQSVSLNEM